MKEAMTFCLFAMASAMAVQCAAEMATVQPKSTDETLINPDMGFVYYHYSNRLWAYGMNTENGDTLDWFPGCSTIYYRLLWNDLEPEEGEFRWDLIDSTAQNWIAKGKKIAIRVICCNQTETATPQFVRDAGAKGVWFRYKDRVNGRLPPRWCPNYDDPIFLAKHEKFLKAMAHRYDGNPGVAFIDVGSYGIYGEGHHKKTPFESLNRSEFVRLAKIHLNLYKKCFPNTYLVVSDDLGGGWNPNEDAEMMVYCREIGIGFRDDSIFCFPPKGMSSCGFEFWAHDGWARKFAQKWPVVVETGHAPYCMNTSGMWSIEAYIRCVEAYQASYMSIHDFPKDHLHNFREAIDGINRILGYRFELREAVFPKVIKAGEKFMVGSKWVNVGVAPRTKANYLAWSLLNANGSVAWTSTDDMFDFRALAPKLNGVEKPKSVRSVCRFGFTTKMPQPDQCVNWARDAGRVFADVVIMLKPGKYRLAVSVGKADGTPEIALPLEGQIGSTRRYVVGEVQILDAS